MARRIALACLGVVAASAAGADTLSDCSQARNPQLRLRACSEVIAGPSYSTEQKALAYRNRGNARADAGVGAQAVADFTEAIHLGEAAGYAGRGRAKLGMQEIEGAIADYNEAVRSRREMRLITQPGATRTS